MKHNLAQIGAEISANNHSHASTIVCLKDLSTGDFKETKNGYFNLNISLTASNYANTITKSWPDNEKDCIGSIDPAYLYNTGGYFRHVPNCKVKPEVSSYEPMKRSLCTILYDYDYRLTVQIHNVNFGDETLDEFSTMTVSPAKFRNVKDLQLKIRQDASAVSTEWTSCTKTSMSMNAGTSYKDVSSNGFSQTAPKKTPEPCSEGRVDKSGTDSFVVNLDVIKPGDSEFE